jgi:carboxylate-amine ligase
MTIEFRSSPTASLGVEVELSLVDRETRALTSAATDTLADISADGAEHPALKHELFESTVEVITGVCDTVAGARSDLEAGIDELRGAAFQRGVGLLCSGTHPFSSYRELQISPSERYHQLVDDMQWPVRRLAINGIHFHVGRRIIASPRSTPLTTFCRCFSLSASLAAGTVRTPAWRRPGQIFEVAHRRAAAATALVERIRGADALIRPGIESVREVWWHPPHPTGTVAACADDDRDHRGSLPSVWSPDGRPDRRRATAGRARGRARIMAAPTADDRGNRRPARTWSTAGRPASATRRRLDAPTG